MKSFILLLSVIALFLFSQAAGAALERESDHERGTHTHFRDNESHEKEHDIKTTKKIVATTKKPKKPVTPAKPVKPIKPAPKSPLPTPSTSTPMTKTSTIDYRTPEGSVKVGFSVTVKDGVITGATSTTQAGGTSKYYQDAFASALSTAVVGKKVSGLKLSAIGGASLTTDAFSQYVTLNF